MKDRCLKHEQKNANILCIPIKYLALHFNNMCNELLFIVKQIDE